MKRESHHLSAPGPLQSAFPRSVLIFSASVTDAYGPADAEESARRSGRMHFCGEAIPESGGSVVRDCRRRHD